MTEHQSTITVDLPADVVFDYLKDVANLPEYLPRMTSARRTGYHEVEVTAHLDLGDQGERDVQGRASFDVDESARELTWGSEGDSDYGGRIGVRADDERSSTVTVALRWHHGDPQDVDADLERSVRRIKAVVEERERPAAAQI